VFFLDKTLWSNYTTELTQKNHIYIDMPAHRNSSDVGFDWEVDECVDMLIQVLDELKIDCCFVIGHSWGSMTALRAAVQYPSRFKAIGLFNMPFKKTLGMRKLGFMMQKLMLPFPRFYAKQAAKSLYSEDKLNSNPDLTKAMQDRLSKRSAKELARIIDGVIINPDDTSKLIKKLLVPALAVIGEQDYVGHSGVLDTQIVSGGHISPQKSITEIEQAIVRVLALSDRQVA